ncbi:helix-turn-helix domain-containing protein [Desulfosporosinus hippei]|uniref:DNA-binding transcriptional regulator, XRE-family HTH domain n=1 Tax=Desulfosporosinus hippei DSM 8344 TaxID=1121419 RepID=A0A1G8GZU8_9FIRM|nr:helix-turn-helix transcriptional regulator [Desulfosporosinus hippei]SDH99887.1 DNA-binding transcriptional regulator, XRE-family HTH domain [Desulfosporosinus hippei DSM 8344]
MNRELNIRLKETRISKGLTQLQVMKLTNVNHKTLSGYENGVSEPDLETLKILAILYNVSTDYLLGRTDDSNYPSIENNTDDEEQPTPSERIRTFQKKMSELSEESLTFLEFQLERLRELDREAVKRRRPERAPKRDKK